MDIRELRIGNWDKTSDEVVFAPYPKNGDYLVGSNGVIISKSKKVRYVHAVTKHEHFRLTKDIELMQHLSKWGRPFVQFKVNGKAKNFTVHRLVAETFIENPHNLPQVNHIDGNRLNNKASNLEWCTAKQNREHAYEHSLHAIGSRVASAKLCEVCVAAIKKMLIEGFLVKDISRLFDISESSVKKIKNNRTWKHVVLSGEELEVDL